MNATLGFFDSLHAQVAHVLQEYLLPNSIAIGIGVTILVLIAFNRRNADASAPEDPARPQVPAPAAPQAAAVQAPAPGPAAPGTGRAAAEDPATRVLVVDDSAVARAKLRKLLESAGYRVDVARDGAEAIEMLGAAFFSVLVTDLEMPNMNGLELIAHVQGSLDTEDLPIVAVTGHDELQARVHEYAGLYGIFKKPWNDRELLRRVETLVAIRKPRPPAAPSAPAGWDVARDPATALSQRTPPA
ncbi:MAG: response regulator [Xylophilus ampelinus]